MSVVGLVRFVPLGRALDSRAKMKLLKFIYGNYSPMSGREMAKVVGLSNATVSRVMRGFEEIDLVTPKKFGNVVTWVVNTESFSYNELKKAASMPLPLEHLISTLRAELSRLPVKRAVLFGSIAHGRERPGSDIDLFILTAKKTDLRGKLDELNEKCLGLYGNPVMPYVLTEEEFKHPSNPSLVENIGKGIVILPVLRGEAI